MEATKLMGELIEIRETVSGKSHLVKVDESAQLMSELIKADPNKDYYRSLFTYPGSMEAHHSERNGVGGFKEEVTAGFLFFDIDNKDLKVAKDDTLKVLNALATNLKLSKDQLISCTDLFFSGNKGFHVFFKTEQRFNPEQMKTIVKKLCSDIGSLDLQIYNTTRIIRIEGTKHQKTGFFKIPLSLETFRGEGIETIKGLAGTPVSFTPASEKFDFENFEEFTEVEKPNLSVVVDTEETVDGVRGLSGIDFTKCPKHVPRCIYALSKGVMVPGRSERHLIFLALARYYKNQGHLKEETHRLLKATAELNARLYPEAEAYTKDRIWNEHIVSVYENDDHFNLGGWGIDPKKDEIFARYCKLVGDHTSIKCAMHESTTGPKDTYSIDELIDDYIEFAENYETSIIKTGINFIDDEMEIMRGTMTLLVGAAGSGKTTFALKLLENASCAGIPSVMFSMDMNKRPLFEKLFLKHVPKKSDGTPMTKMDVRELARNDKETYKKVLREVLNKYYKNVVFVTKGTMSSEEMKAKVEAVSADKGKVGLVLVDYAGRISSGKSDSYANDKHNALRGPEIASDTDAAWVYLCQVGRNSGDSHIPLRTKRAAKGAGDWEEAAQNVITIWRPFADLDGVVYEEDDLDEQVVFRDNIMRAYTAKNRMGKSREVILSFDGKNIREGGPGAADHYQENRQHHEKYAYKYKSGAKSFGS